MIALSERRIQESGYDISINNLLPVIVIVRATVVSVPHYLTVYILCCQVRRASREIQIDADTYLGVLRPPHNEAF